MSHICHCERSEAISMTFAHSARDCFVASLLAMTRAARALRRDSQPAGVAETRPLPFALHRLGDLEGELQGLAGVEARVAMRVVAVGERGFADRLRAADAF